MKRTVRRYRKNRNRRTGKWRKQRGGAMSKELGAFRFAYIGHPYISQIGPLKPVATPNSGPKPSEFDKFINLWFNLNPEDKNELNRMYLKGYKFTLDAYISVEHIFNMSDIENPIIFYAKEYLDVLAQAAEITTDEILMIIATRSVKTPKEMDIIHIAFGDEYLHGDKLSEWGTAVKERYLAMLPATANLSKIPKLPGGGGAP